jgi:hypothetical protein
MKTQKALRHTSGKSCPKTKGERSEISFGPHGNDQVAGSHTTPTRAIANDLDLFVWLFEELDRSYPRIPVSAMVDGALNGLLESVEGSDCIDYRPAYFHEIFAVVSRKKIPSNAPLRGLKLLMFVGRLSAEMERIGGFVEVPRNWAAAMMLEDSGYLGSGLEYTSGRHRLRSTAEFTREHRVQVNVKLPRRYPIVDSAWELIENIKSGICLSCCRS